MRVLIDGHNALGALKIDAATHEQRRRGLLRRVAAVAPDATVFFDARRAPRIALDVASEAGVKVRYCRHGEADAAILDAVRAAAAPGRVLVVTNDREVAGRAAQLGARTARIREFFGADQAGPAPAGPPPRLGPRMEPRDFGLPEEVDLSDPDLGDDEES